MKLLLIIIAFMALPQAREATKLLQVRIYDGVWNNYDGTSYEMPKEHCRAYFRYAEK